MNDVGDRTIQEFLKNFDNDPVRAVKEIRRYVVSREHQLVAKKPPIELGETIIAVENVSKTYKVGRQKITALHDISLEIKQGEMVALTGASGSGKSTLLQLIGGLDKPTEGVICVDGSNLKKLSDRKLSQFRNQTIGFVFQSFYLQPFLNLRLNLEIPGMFARTKPSLRHQRADELAKLVDVSERINHKPKELSGGQTQRVAIARALFNNPKILLADEPTGNLDSTNSDNIIKLFETIRQELGTTIVIVTHNPDIAARADHEITLRDGRIV